MTNRSFTALLARRQQLVADMRLERPDDEMDQLTELLSSLDAQIAVAPCSGPRDLAHKVSILHAKLSDPGGLAYDIGALSKQIALDVLRLELSGA